MLPVLVGFIRPRQKWLGEKREHVLRAEPTKLKIGVCTLQKRTVQKSTIEALFRNGPAGDLPQ